jgi:hypothetical protein
MQYKTEAIEMRKRVAISLGSKLNSNFEAFKFFILIIELFYK